MAGMQKRKVYGIKMWRFGYAAQLLLSVDRFEWRKCRDLNLESDGGLEVMVNQIPAPKRHFFVRMDRQAAYCTPVKKGFLGTRSEAQAFKEYFRTMPVRSLLVVSSPLHMRRVALAFRRAFRKSGIQLTFVAVPENISFNNPTIRSAVWAELCKYLLYLATNI
jgi:hypothetical protein